MTIDNIFQDRELIHSYLHWMCNQQCSYCLLGRTRNNDRAGMLKKYKTLLPHLLDFFRTLQPSNIALSGGEPLITEDIGDIFDTLSSAGHKIILYSNLKRNAIDVITKHSPSEYVFIQASLHATEFGRINEIYKTISHLRREKYPIIINVVLSREALDFFPTIEAQHLKYNIPISFTPMIFNNPASMPRMYSHLEWNKISKHIHLYASWIVFSGGFKSFGRRCKAGLDTLCSFPDGSVYPCTDTADNESFKLGNLLNFNQISAAPAARGIGYAQCKNNKCTCILHHISGIIDGVDTSMQFSNFVRNNQQGVSYDEFREWASAMHVETVIDISPYFVSSTSYHFTQGLPDDYNTADKS